MTQKGPQAGSPVQELFALPVHPTIAGGRVAWWSSLVARQPGRQVTRDRPGFWRGDYAAVRAEMRGATRAIRGPTSPVRPRTRRANPLGT